MDEARRSGIVDAEYFGRVLERVRAIRDSGDEMSRRVRDALALAVDYSPTDARSRNALLAVQMQLLSLATGKSPAERIDDYFRRGGPSASQSYLSEKANRELNRLISLFLDFAEDRAGRGEVIFLYEWPEQLDHLAARAAGEVHGRAAVLLKLLQLKFGPLPQAAAERVQSANIDELDAWTERVLSAASLEDIVS